MPRYIDADKLALHLSDYALQESPNWGANGYGNQDAYDAINECIKAIDDQPTADVVEVVRCKDCKHHYTWTDINGCLYHSCDRWLDTCVRISDFCSKGEKL